MIKRDHSFSIGGVRIENPLILAPLAGVTNLPFRILALEQGAALSVTEMVSAMGLVRAGKKTMDLLATISTERPFCVQLFGKNPEILAEAAAKVQDLGADMVDLNMGCPARKVVRHGSGSALLKDFKLIESIVKKVRSALRIPLTVKTRAGWRPGEGEIMDLAPILADQGVDAVTLHPRFAIQRFGGQADWDLVARLVEFFPGPVVGNGDITRPQHVLTRLSSSGCAGVMIGRGAMGNPWIFSQALALLQGRPVRLPDLDTRLRTALSHARMLERQIGAKRTTTMLRSVLMWYTKGLPDSSTFRGSINRTNEFNQVMTMLAEYFSRISAGRFQETQAS